MTKTKQQSDCFEPPLPGDTSAAATLVLKLGYRGGDFSGFAEQEGRRTVAGELRRALETFLHREVEITCAGRTDAGVHALGQVVSVPVMQEELGIPSVRLHKALCALTPDDIAIHEPLMAPANFSARFDALLRSYRYRIYAHETRPVLSWSHAWWVRSPLDVMSMDEALKALIGEHDFASFAKTSSIQGKSSVRELLDARAFEVEEAGEKLIAIDICGNAFLHNMVRNIVGSLVEVGRGHKKPEWMDDVLGACDRRLAGPCAPANGLTFVMAAYPQGLLVPWGVNS